MTLSKKEQTIRAFKKLTWKYRHPEGKTFFTFQNCPLCKVHYTMDCRGCPLADEFFDTGCEDFESYENAKWASIMDRDQYFEERAAFFEKILPIIEAWPPERFTKKGWEYSGDEIPRSW